MFSAEDSGSGYHPVMYETRGGDDKSGMGGSLWAIVIVIVFLVVIFFAFAMMFRRNGREGIGSGVAEVAALGALKNNNGGTIPAASAAFTEINGRFDALTQHIGHINDVNDLRDLKRTQADLSLQIATNRTDTLLNFKDLTTTVLQGDSEINRNVDNTRCQIIQNADANTRAILERMFQDENQRLRDELAREREARARENLSASQAVQNSYLINQLRPYPQAAFSVLPPVPVGYSA